MPERSDAKFLQVVGGELRQDFGVDSIIDKRLRILSKTEAAKPLSNVHTSPVRHVSYSRVRNMSNVTSSAMT